MEDDSSKNLLKISETFEVRSALLPEVLSHFSFLEMKASTAERPPRISCLRELSALGAFLPFYGSAPFFPSHPGCPLSKPRIEQVLASLRASIMEGDLVSGTAITFADANSPYHLPPTQAVLVASVLCEEGLLRHRGNMLIVSHLSEQGLVEMFFTLWGHLRATVPRVAKEAIDQKGLLSVRDALRKEAKGVTNFARALQFLEAFRTAIQKLLHSIGLRDSAITVIRQLRRFHLADPHAFRFHAAHDLGEDVAALVTQLLSDELHARTIRDLLETLLQHLFQSWSLDSTIRRFCPEVVWHGPLTLGNHAHGPRIATFDL